jgi:hypothetical protein
VASPGQNGRRGRGNIEGCPMGKKYEVTFVNVAGDDSTRFRSVTAMISGVDLDQPADKNQFELIKSKDSLAIPPTESVSLGFSIPQNAYVTDVHASVTYTASGHAYTKSCTETAPVGSYLPPPRSFLLPAPDSNAPAFAVDTAAESVAASAKPTPENMELAPAHLGLIPRKSKA